MSVLCAGKVKDNKKSTRFWPTELKRRVGKLTASRCYNQPTFAAITPWRIQRELAVQHLPVCCFLRNAVQK